MQSRIMKSYICPGAASSRTAGPKRRGLKDNLPIFARVEIRAARPKAASPGTAT